MKFTLFAAAAALASTAVAFPITGDTVNCRSGPGTSYAVKKSYAKGHDVTITCQTGGTSVSGNSIWDKTSDGCYVADYYVKTGSSGYVKPKCSSGGGGGSCSAPKSNAATVDLIAEFEGFVAKVYIDATGHPTVGYGHLCTKSKCAEIGYPIPLSTANGKKLLATDIAKAEKCVTAMLNSKAVLNANQYGALVSLAFNVGCGAVQSSSIVTRLNKGENAATVYPQEFPKWVHGNGKVLPGLVRRRNAEVALAKKAAGKALPC
ncbi:hypothetical protein VE00_04930 [Pseudogymnoascus sp. WSF 3629]|nr:hypothetical protein VE00_04930 [Pseudogymnoascus sp. WSF 3629]